MKTVRQELARFWLSWFQPTEDMRPLNSPPNPAILGWWSTGQRLSDEAWTICALVVANGEDAAKDAVRVDWPEAQEWRFCTAVEADYRPSDRFPEAVWMAERIGARDTGKEPS